MLEPGQVVDRYRVLARIGDGGMAEVFQVRHIHLQTLHALKVHTSVKRSIKVRFEREGRIQASIGHPNVVRVSDVIDLGERTGLVMEFINGPSLSQLLRRFRPPVSDAIALFRGFAAGLGHAHLMGLIHRDLKPSNVLLRVEDGRTTAMLTDFGLAKNLIAAPDLRTRTGATLGTPAYMPPEQIRDASKVDHRADLYGLGCLLYTVCCGRPPFRGSDVVDLLERVEAGNYPAPSTLIDGLPPAVEALIADLLRPAPDDRPGDVQEVLERLGSIGTDPVSAETQDVAASLVRAFARRLREQTEVQVFVPTSPAPRPLKTLGVATRDEARARIRGAAAQCGLSVVMAESAPQGLTQLISEADAGRSFELVLIDDGVRGGLLESRIGRDPRFSGCRVVRADQVPGGVGDLARVVRGVLPPPPSEVADPTHPTSAQAVAKTVLVVEDNRVQRTLLCHLLDRAGLQVVAVGDLGQARQALDRQPFDGMIVDVHLPDGSGLDFLNRLHDRGTAPPTVVLTADRQVLLPARAPGGPPVELLPKPFRNWELQGCLDRLLNADGQGERSVVDVTVLEGLAEMLGGGQQPVLELIDVFLGDLHNEQEAWRRVLATKEGQQVQELVRRLAPAAAHLGAQALEQVCVELSDPALQRDWARTEPVVQRVLQLLDRTAEHLVAYRDRIRRKAS